MKKSVMIAALAMVVSFGSISCKKKVTDADLQTQATTVVTSNPNATVEVKDGVAHLSGTFEDQASKDAMIASLKAIPGIKEVMDMSTVAAPVEINSVDTVALQKVQDAVKDFPSVKAEVINGEVVLTGTVSSLQARKIKESVDALTIPYTNNIVVK
ncbi:BON domain-containing protein [Planobacterium oryzisoli]|uniref:BON domain-containing protein n=1 Tax=Planobacterium oryzisoli TaxID=2771435 RepID=A0A930YUC5_9FLAO|nr:BON domain-containing protein [Planobacterium oryzisoli]MBF5026517.1 BON domain-containing protein [Planobacterium oryzisoli]